MAAFSQIEVVKDLWVVLIKIYLVTALVNNSSPCFIAHSMGNKPMVSLKVITTVDTVTIVAITAIARMDLDLGTLNSEVDNFPHSLNALVVYIH